MRSIFLSKMLKKIKNKIFQFLDRLYPEIDFKSVKKEKNIKKDIIIFIILLIAIILVITYTYLPLKISNIVFLTVYSILTMIKSIKYTREKNYRKLIWNILLLFGIVFLYIFTVLL